MSVTESPSHVRQTAPRRAYTWRVQDLFRTLRPALLSLTLCIPVAAQVRVINDGFPGENTEELSGRLEGALQQFHPQIVILFAGGNDSLNDKKLLTATQTAANLDSMVKQVQTHGAKPVLVQVHDPDMARLMTRHKPEAYGKLQPLERLALINREIARIAKKDHAALVPFNAVLHDAGGTNADLSTDGVHLTSRGYGLLAQAIRTHLPKQLAPDTTVLCFGDSLTYGIGVRSPGNAPETPETYPSQLRKLLQ